MSLRRRHRSRRTPLGRFVAASLLAWLLGEAAWPLHAFAEQEVHACGCVGVCVCGHAERETSACTRHLAPDVPTFERCTDERDPVTGWQTTVEEPYDLRLPFAAVTAPWHSSPELPWVDLRPPEPPPRPRA